MEKHILIGMAVFTSGALAMFGSASAAVRTEATSMPVILPYPAYGTPAPGVRNATSVPGVPQIVTLRQAMEISFARSPLLASAQANESLAYANVVSQKAGWLPTITAAVSAKRTIGKAQTFTGGGFAGDVTSNGLGVTLNQLVYDGGYVAAKIHSAKRGDAAQIDTYRRTLQTVAYNTAQAYYAMLAAQRTTVVDTEVVRENIVQRDLVAAQARAGTEAAADIATAELPVAQARLALVQAQGTELAAQAAFANAMGLDADADVRPFDDTPIFTQKSIETINVPTYAQAIVRALAMRPDYDAALQTVEAERFAYVAARRAVLPTLSGTASTGTSSTNFQGGAYAPSSTIGLEISLPIFAPGLVQAGTEQARGNLDVARASFAIMREALQLNVKQALIGFISARAAVDQANAEYTDALTVLQSTRARYRVGVTTLPLLLDAEVGYTSALAAQVQTVYALRQAEQAFLYAEGENDLDRS
jgi:outer membrane protein